jgi:hypothetical protein
MMDNPIDQVKLKDAAARVRSALDAVNAVSEAGIPGTHPLAVSMREDLAALGEALTDLGSRSPLAPNQGLRDAAKALAENPVFIGGVHKSGTTLLRNLLDAHPDLLVLPTDGKGYQWVETQLVQAAGDNLMRMSQEIIKQLIAPLGGTPPNWVLSKQTGDVQPYLKFAQHFFYWQQEAPANTSRNVMLVLVCALYCTLASSSTITPKYWVEKSTRNADYTETLLGLFPRAKFIHIMRHPAAIISAQKIKEPTKGRPFNMQYEIDNWRKVTELGLKIGHKWGSGVYHIVRYEDLVANPEKAMRELANFLELPFRDILLTPTVNGYPASSNTAYKGLAPAPGKLTQATVDHWRESLAPAEIRLVNKQLGSLMESLGYSVETKSFFRRAISLVSQSGARSSTANSRSRRDDG